MNYKNLYFVVATWEHDNEPYCRLFDELKQPKERKLLLMTDKYFPCDAAYMRTMGVPADKHFLMRKTGTTRRYYWCFSYFTWFLKLSMRAK